MRYYNTINFIKMRSILFSLFFFYTVVSFGQANCEATVSTLYGVCVFVDSKPLIDYDYLGTIESKGIVVSKDYEDLMPKIVKRAKDKYPDADGVIFTGNIYSCQVIQFKK